MLIKQAINRIKVSTHDATDEYSSEHCLDFLNNAVQQVHSQLAAARYAPIIQHATLKNKDRLPQDFMLAAGQYPMRVTDYVIEITDDAETEIRLRYFGCAKTLTSDDKELPYTNEAVNEVIVKLAIMLALNENEFDISQDTALMQSLSQAVASGMGIATGV